MSYFDDASLVMIPSGYKTSKVYSVKPTDGSGDLTFSRSNDTATRVNSAGLIEKVRTNYITTQNFSLWSKLLGTEVVTSGVADPFGGTNAYNLSGITAGNYSSGLTIVVTIPVGANSYFTTSVYMKGSGTIALTGQGTGFFSPLPITLTSTWTRYNITISPSSAISTATLYISNFTGSTATSVDLAFTQVELGDIATSYIATTSAAVSVGPVANVPRLDYLNSSCPRLLLEPQRTNLATYSEQFNNAAWGKAASGTALAPVVTANNAISPDGYQNADTIVFDAGAGTTSSDSSALFQTFGGTTATYTGSFYAKTASGTAQIQVRIDGNNYDKFTITNQWQRFTLTKALTGTSNVFEMVIRRGLNEPMNASATIQLWGVQVELGAYPTSYIPTLGAAVTRGADAASKTGISSLIGQTEGTLFVDMEFEGYDNLAKWIAFLGTGSSYIGFYTDNVSRFVAEVANTTAQFINSTFVFAVGQRYKLALAYKENDFAFYVNGTQVATDNSGTVPATSQFDFQYNTTANNLTARTYNQALLFKTRLTNAQLAELTTI